MKWDWLGYPGMLEDKNDESLVKLLTILTTNQTQFASSMLNLIEAVKNLKERIEQLERKVP